MDQLFCRREPKEQKSTDDMFLLESSGEIILPKDTPKKNQSAKKVRAYLDEFAGLTNLDFDIVGTGSGFKGRPSFGDMKAFCFQPQNIIANPDVLFFKADTFDHREKLKTIFPYVLNAVTAKTLAAQHEHDLVRREYLRKQQQLNELQTASRMWLAELQSWVSEARNVGLTTASMPDPTDADAMIEILRGVLDQPTIISPTQDGIEELAREIIELRKEEELTAESLGIFGRRYTEMSKLKDSAEVFAGALEIQRDRLAISKWLQTLAADTNCPLCTTALEGENVDLTEFCAVLEELESEASASRSIPASFDREMARVQREIGLATESLRSLRLRLDSAESRSSEAQEERYQSDSAARLMGRIEQALHVHDRATVDSELADEVADLRAQMNALSRQFSVADIRRRIDNAIKRITSLAALIIPNLDAEHETDPIELQLNDLTVKVIGPDRENYLWEIGSGANWLSYHVAITIALQQLFLDFDSTPVPGFVVFDQPSQVYFPRKLARADDDDEDPKLENDEDVVAVRKVFSALADATTKAAGRLQVIVLDHASKDVWGDIEGVHSVEEWRDGRKLVPQEWL